MINSNTATNFLPFRTEFKDWNSSSSPSISRRSSSSSLNNSLAVTPTAEPSTSSAPVNSSSAAVALGSSDTTTTPVKTESMMTSYFAASHRIRNGEGFRLLGRRHGPDGRTQFLIEWNGNGNTSLF